MKIGVVVFPGSNCDHDAWHAISQNGHQAEFIWHDSASLGDIDAVILPGGFSYGDYLRCGAIARFSPVLNWRNSSPPEAVQCLGSATAFRSWSNQGCCPVRCRATRNLSLSARRSICAWRPLTRARHSPGDEGSGVANPHRPWRRNYFADARTLDELEAEDRVAFRYVGACNGSQRDIAGILNRERNVLGMMPHPERAADPLMGSTDGMVILQSLANAVAVSR